MPYSPSLLEHFDLFRSAHFFMFIKAVVTLAILRCGFYDEKDKQSKENCCNCHNWVSDKCINHLKLVKEQKFRDMDRLMKSRSCVEGPI